MRTITLIIAVAGLLLTPGLAPAGQSTTNAVKQPSPNALVAERYRQSGNVEVLFFKRGVVRWSTNTLKSG